VKVVEELPALGLAMSELAKKVGSMRDRWKALDAVSGHAPRSLWERFDRACTTACGRLPPISNSWPTSATPMPPRRKR
jgi:hypothetical protein